MIRPSRRPLFAVTHGATGPFIEDCAFACDLRANMELGGGGQFERRALVARSFVQTLYLRPDCREFR
jgi:hypothetical protein